MILGRKCYILQSEGGLHYKFAVNRYRLVEEGVDDWQRRARRDRGPAPITLVLLHALGLHKETWEPFLEDLRNLQLNDQKLRARGWVTEAWAVDCASHGDSAILNEEKLRVDEGFHSSNEFARSTMTLLDSPCFASSEERRLVLVGHSGGAVAAALVMRECMRRWPLGNNPFEGFIIIESPVLATPLSPLQERSDHWMSIGGVLSKFTEKRRDKWKDVKEAYAWFSTRPPYSDWDPRVLFRYVEYGLRPLPTAFYPNDKHGSGLTLKAYRTFESRPFAGREETTTAGAVLEEIHTKLPTHVVFGENSPFRPNEQDIPHLTSRKGKNSFYVSATDIPGVNHLLIQEAPTTAARVLLHIINRSDFATVPPPAEVAPRVAEQLPTFRRRDKYELRSSL